MNGADVPRTTPNARVPLFSPRPVYAFLTVAAVVASGVSAWTLGADPIASASLAVVVLGAFFAGYALAARLVRRASRVSFIASAAPHVSTAANIVFALFAVALGVRDLWRAVRKGDLPHTALTAAYLTFIVWIIGAWIARRWTDRTRRPAP